MKTIKWMGSSYQDVINFPADAKRNAGYNLDRVQRELEPCDWKPMPSVGPGVKEIRIHLNNEYRIVYVAKYSNAIYVLHAFVKKTQKTEKKYINLAKERLKDIKRSKQ